MKKLFAFLIVISIVFFCTATAFAAKEDGKITSGDYDYILTDGGAQLIKYNGESKNVEIPSEIDGHRVVKVGCDLLKISSKDVRWSYSTSDYEKFCLKSYGFARKNIESVKIPDTVTELSAGCFYRCEALKSVVLSKKLRYIPQQLFYGCKSLLSVALPESVDEICDGAFVKTGITKLSVPAGVRVINEKAFGNKLQKLNVAKKNKSYSSKGGVLYNKKKTILYFYPHSKPSGSFTVPSKVKLIRANSFRENKKLQRLTIPKSVRVIGEEAFGDCGGLAKVSFKPRGGKRLKIEDKAFTCGKNLKELSLPKNTRLGYYAVGYDYSFWDDEFGQISRKTKGFVLKGYKGSAVEKYAKRNELKFKAAG